jgi:hypothetical protein
MARPEKAPNNLKGGSIATANCRGIGSGRRLELFRSDVSPKKQEELGKVDNGPLWEDKDHISGKQTSEYPKLPLNSRRGL